MVNVIGVMSGTSLDGIDICHARFTSNSFEVVNYLEVEYSLKIKQKIISAIGEELTLSELTSLDYELGFEYARAIQVALDEWNLSNVEIDVIANHGQTIYHNDGKPGVISSTLQLGNGDIIKAQLDISVVSDFRAADIAVGNRGAPLVQIFDDYLIANKRLENSNFLNIGGISNIYLSNQNLSFDTGPGNMMINYAVNKLYGLEYDRDGVIAASGVVDDKLFEELTTHAYFSHDEQLSTGREDFGDQYTEQILKKYKHVPACDIICTLTMFTARSIASEVLKRSKDQEMTIYVSGGGAYNPTLLKFLSESFGQIKIKRIDDIGIGANLKEAVAFAYFGYANYQNIKLKTLNGNKTILGVLHRRG